MKHKEGIGKIIWEKRNKLDLSQKKFAAKIKITPAYLSAIETGKKNPSMVTLNKICEEFNYQLTLIELPPKKKPNGKSN